MSDTIHFTAASSGHVVDAAHLLDGVSAYGANEAGNLQTEGTGADAAPYPPFKQGLH